MAKLRRQNLGNESADVRFNVTFRADFVQCAKTVAANNVSIALCKDDSEFADLWLCSTAHVAMLVFWMNEERFAELFKSSNYFLLANAANLRVALTFGRAFHADEG
jgi:hypothetical protein